MLADRSQSPRVAMLAHTYYLRDARVRREAEALAEQGLEVHVIALSGEFNDRGEPEPRRATLNGVQIHRLPLRRRRGSALRYLFEYLSIGLLGALKLAALHLRGKLDVVHVHNMPDILVLAAIVPRLGGSKVVLDVHDPMPELYTSQNRRSKSVLVKLLRLQERISCAFAHRIISVNESLRENLQSKGVNEVKISIVNNFPDERLFAAPETRRTAWPRSRDSLVLLYCGTVTEHYDLGLAVRSIARVVGEVPIKLRILGEGNKLTEVLQLASALGVGRAVEHVGSVPIERVRGEMQQADVGISCHRAGVFGDLYFSTKIVEYLTQDLPVLSPRTYTMEKYLPANIVFYFEPGSEAELADRLRFMWHHPVEVLSRVRLARELLPRFSWEAEKAKLHSLYSALVNEPPRTAAVLGPRRPPTRKGQSVR